VHSSSGDDDYALGLFGFLGGETGIFGPRGIVSTRHRPSSIRMMAVRRLCLSGPAIIFALSETRVQHGLFHHPDASAMEN
jgi:hypothetical protein